MNGFLHIIVYFLQSLHEHMHVITNVICMSLYPNLTSWYSTKFIFRYQDVLLVKSLIRLFCVIDLLAERNGREVADLILFKLMICLQVLFFQLALVEVVSPIANSTKQRGIHTLHKQILEQVMKLWISFWLINLGRKLLKSLYS